MGHCNAGGLGRFGGNHSAALGLGGGLGSALFRVFLQRFFLAAFATAIGRHFDTLAGGVAFHPSAVGRLETGFLLERFALALGAGRPHKDDENGSQ